MCAQEELSIRGGILADEMGMGKTLQVPRRGATPRAEGCPYTPDGAFFVRPPPSSGDGGLSGASQPKAGSFPRHFRLLSFFGPPSQAISVMLAHSSRDWKLLPKPPAKSAKAAGKARAAEEDPEDGAARVGFTC